MIFYLVTILITWLLLLATLSFVEGKANADENEYGVDEAKAFLENKKYVTGSVLISVGVSIIPLLNVVAAIITLLAVLDYFDIIDLCL